MLCRGGFSHYPHPKNIGQTRSFKCNTGSSDALEAGKIVEFDEDEK